MFGDFSANAQEYIFVFPFLFTKCLQKCSKMFRFAYVQNFFLLVVLKFSRSFLSLTVTHALPYLVNFDWCICTDNSLEAFFLCVSWKHNCMELQRVILFCVKIKLEKYFYREQTYFAEKFIQKLVQFFKQKFGKSNSSMPQVICFKQVRHLT